MITRIFTFSRTFIITLFLLMSVELVAQPGNPDCPEPPCQGDDVPITGIELLIGAGAIWGAKKYADSRKQRK
ncbi:MAG TPA: hypothetical protein VD884_06070 [Ohtaekwangia sp.]|nr:hypothetical protein [Ohtaekwangia sp.]